MDGVTIVIPCYNPAVYLMEAIASARAQRGCAVEVVLVNDGTDSPDGRKALEGARGLVDRYLEQPNRGLAAARNAGFDAARYPWIVPLDADDRLEPGYAAACGAALAAQPDAAFAYTDYRVFGRENYAERLSEYNLYRMLDRNVLTYAALIHKRDWAEAGGYDEAMKLGYEDWEFWLRLGDRGRFGAHVGQVLFGYRKHGPSLLDTARAHHQEIASYIRARHPALYQYQARARVKARWSPSVEIVASEAQIGRQSIEDWRRTAQNAPAVLMARGDAPLAPESAELAALAVWGGHDAVELADGSMALSRRGYERQMSPARLTTPSAAATPRRLETVHRHLANAGLLQWDAWTRHPLRSAGRLIPLRFKEQANRIAGRPFFDLSFYLQFQPAAIESGVRIAEPLEYMPVLRTSRRRIGLVTPHLGPGGAERVLLDVAGALDPQKYELFLMATQSSGDAWLAQWRALAGHVYDLRKWVGAEKAGAAVYSICVNWGLDTVLVQNSLPGYSVLPAIKERLPGIRIIDVIHAVDADWNLVTATRAVDAEIDVRVAISSAVRQELIAQGVAAGKIRQISNGVDLERFHDLPGVSGGGRLRILFAGRLDAVKRPLLLPEIAVGLRQRRDDFRMVVAGDGPESGRLRQQVRALGVEALFEFRGHVADIAPELAACTVVVLPSRSEGIPLIVLEAFAASRPVVASAVGGVPEVVTADTGMLVPAGKTEVADFVTALDGLLSDAELRRRLGTNGRRMVELHFDRSRAAEAYRGLFE